MPLVSRIISSVRAGLLLALGTVWSAGCQDRAGPVAVQPADTPSPPPLEINFKQASRLPAGREQVYDAATGTFHIHFDEPTRNKYGVISYHYERAVEVTKVAEQFAKPVVFRLTGVPDNYGCVGHALAFVVGDKSHALVAGTFAPGPVDQTLFRVERKDEVVTVAFTEKGQALLKPGALIAFQVDTGW